MVRMSVWRASAPASSWPSLGNDVLTADVAIVGGGITGVTLALRLAGAGRSVVLLDAADIAGGATGNSTGNVYQTISSGLHALTQKWDASTVRRVVESRSSAMAAIEKRIHEHRIACGWRRCPLYRYTSAASDSTRIEHEFRASLAAGLNARLEQALPAGVPAPAEAVVALDDQAQLQPWAYVHALAQQVAAKGCRVFEHSPVQRVDRDRKALVTAHGEVSAHDIVFATHTPSGFHLVQAEMVPRQEYGIAFVAGDASIPPGIFWDVADPPLSVRSVEADDGTAFIVCIGQQHKTGQHDALQAMEDLERTARDRLPRLGEARFRWSAQNFQPADGLPYIGRDLSGAYIATGFAADGLVYGTLAADMIADEILGRDHPWADLYRPGRFEPAKAAQGVVEENVAVVKELVRGYVNRAAPNVDGIAPGEGRVVQMNGDALAVHRDEQGTLHAVSAVCTHLKCKVRWNTFEKSWDCPCHGSRFQADGQVICGPAIEPLATVRFESADTVP